MSLIVPRWSWNESLMNLSCSRNSICESSLQQCWTLIRRMSDHWPKYKPSPFLWIEPLELVKFVNRTPGTRHICAIRPLALIIFMNQTPGTCHMFVNLTSDTCHVCESCIRPQTCHVTHVCESPRSGLQALQAFSWIRPLTLVMFVNLVPGTYHVCESDPKHLSCLWFTCHVCESDPRHPSQTLVMFVNQTPSTCHVCESGQDLKHCLRIIKISSSFIWSVVNHFSKFICHSTTTALITCELIPCSCTVAISLVDLHQFKLEILTHSAI